MFRKQNVKALRPLLLALLALWVRPAGAAADWRMSGVVPSDWRVQVEAPLSVPLPVGQAKWERLEARILVQDGSPRTTMAQSEPADPVGGTPARAWLFWTAAPGEPGERITVEFADDGRRAGGESGPGSGSGGRQETHRVQVASPQLHVTEPDGRPVLSYWYGAPAADWKLPLTSFIHPLVGLDGEVLTALSPSDHLHHRGVFWSWVRHELDGKLIGDWWIPRNIHLEPGDITFSQGPVFTRFVARHWWVHQPPGSAEGVRFVQEDVVCRVFAASGQGRAIDLDLTLTALKPAVRIGGQTAGGKGYGGMTIRFGPAHDARIISEGREIKEANVNRLKSRWVDWSGVFEGPDGKPLPGPSGGTLMVHPSHPPLPDSPPEWITRFYGPINTAYPGLDMLAIPKEQPLRLRYRIWVHRGSAADGGAEDQYRAYTGDFRWAVQE